MAQDKNAGQDKHTMAKDVKVIYAVNSDFAMAGTGFTVFKRASALESAGMLKQVLCRSHAPCAIPDDKIVDAYPGGRRLSQAITALSFYGGQLFPSDWLNNVIFDRAIRKRVKDCDAFIAWNSPLKTLALAKKQGIVAIKEVGSAHPLTWKRIAAQEELRRRIRIPISNIMVKREVKEIALADHIFVPAEFVRQSYIEHGVPARKLHVLPWGVDVKRFTPTPMPTGTFTALFVGQLRHRKGILDLLEAWDLAKLPDARLLLVGTPHKELGRRLDAYRKRKDIEFVGFANPADYLKKSHLFVLPALEDGFPLAVMEAMAAGRPCLVTDQMGSTDIVRQGKEGFVVKAGDPKSIAAALRAAYDNRQALVSMGKQARHTVEGMTWEKTGENVVKVLRTILKVS